MPNSLENSNRFSTRLAKLAAYLFALPFSCLWAQVVLSQDIQISTPFGRVSDSNYERVGVNWGFNFGGPSSQMFGSFNQGSSSSAIPPFGGYDPNADATFGFGSLNDNGSGFSLGIRMGKGNSRTMTSNSPSVVVPNGGFGSIFDGRLRPFVTGLIPVVGEPGDIVEPYYPPLQPPPAAAKSWADAFDGDRDTQTVQTSGTTSINYSNENSSALHGDLSVAEIRQQRAAALDSQKSEVEKLIADATAFELDGKYSRARSLYRKAVKRTEGSQRYELQLKLESLLNK